LKPVKVEKGSILGPLGERLAILLDVFSPWEGISLTYKQFAAELGPPVTEAAVKKWPHRKKFPADVGRLIVARARERGISNVTLDWVLWGDGQGPSRTPRETPTHSAGGTSPASRPAAGRSSRPAAAQEPHGQFAVRIARALEGDLSHNEFGQWSSVEVQHTVIWALKDLARRLRVLRFDMGKTFELTDSWAGTIGLPVRTPEASVDGADEDRG
jgi:hypothetical protein